MLDPATVWAIELGRGVQTETQGSLSLEADAIVFTATGGHGPRRIALAQVRKARRVLGSPILVVEHVEGGERRHTAFYFSQPPPLEPAGRTTTRKLRRQNVGYLGTTNRQKKEVVRRWETAVREATGRGGR